MAILLNNAQGVVQNIVTTSLNSISVQLQKAIDNNDTANMLALNGLRGKYIFDQMKANRAAITAIDGDPSTADLLNSLDNAIKALTTIQGNSNNTNKWINGMSDGIDDVFGIFSKIAQF